MGSRPLRPPPLGQATTPWTPLGSLGTQDVPLTQEEDLLLAQDDSDDDTDDDMMMI